MTNAGSSKRALDLLTELKNVIQEKDNKINAQADKIDLLEKENSDLQNRVKYLENKLKNKRSNENKDVRIIRSSSATNHTYKREFDGSGDLSSSVRRSSSFQKRHLEEQDAGKSIIAYELSSDIIDKRIQVLRNFYGGQAKAENAATIIQQAFRKYRMKQNFRKIRHSKTRRLTIENKLNHADLPHSSTISEADENQTNTETNNTTSETAEPPPTSTSLVEVVELVLEHSYVENTDDSQSKDVQESTAEPEKNVNTSSSPSSENEEDSVKSVDEVDSGTLKKRTDSNDEEAKSTTQETIINDTISLSETKEDLVAQILSSTPPEMLAEASSSHRKRRKHGYETVVPMRIKQQDITKGEDNKPTFVIKDEDDKLVKDGFRRSMPMSSSLRSRNSDRDSMLIDSGVPFPWSRTGSEVSLTGYENDPDVDSIRSSDSASLASVQSDLSTIANSYQRRSTLSARGSWHENNDIMRKRLYRIGLNLFNKKPAKGLEFLIEHQFVQRSAPAVAQFLLNRKGLSRQMVGDYLGDRQRRFNQDVLDSVCELMDFSAMDLDEALRNFQSQIKVQGEAQKVERLIECFSQRYCICNPKLIETIENPDSIFVLAFAIIMLNTDLHTPNIKQEKRMTAAAFAKNLRGIDNGKDLDEQMLFNIYNRIRDNELKTNDDHVSHVVNIEKSILGKKPVLAVPYRRLVCYCRLYQVNDPTKPQKPGLHQREVFLFNDLLLVTKVLQRKKNNTTYTYKSSLPLQGMNVLLFETAHYMYGIRLISSVDNKVLVTFNSPNDHDRSKFITDLKESIMEVQQMENYRIGAELERVQMGNDQHNAFSDTKKMSTSMQNLNDAKGQRNYTNQLGNLSERPVSMYTAPSNIDNLHNQNNHQDGGQSKLNANINMNNNIVNNSQNLLSTPSKSENSLLGHFFGSGRRSKTNASSSPVNTSVPQITFTYSSKV